MGDNIIDTNVLLIASARDAEQGGKSKFMDSDVPAEQKQIVLDWLMEFRKDGQRKMVLDQSFKIWDEYHNQMIRGQDIGSLVVAEKLQFALARFVVIEFDRHGNACLPAGLEKVDPSDRKFVAVALKDLSEGGHSIIVHAVDSGWYECEKELASAGIALKHLIGRFGKGKSKRSGNKKRPSKAKK